MPQQECDCIWLDTMVSLCSSSRIAHSLLASDLSSQLPTTTKHHVQVGLPQCESGIYHIYSAADKVTSNMLCTKHAYMHACSLVLA